jgi:S1-C subfamily serine protease
MSESASAAEALEQDQLRALVAIKTYVPEDAMTAALLGTERTGHGVRIRQDGLIVTIGYLVNEADEIWVTTDDGFSSPAFVIGNDFRSGLALIKPTIALDGPSLEIAPRDELKVGDAVVVAGSAGADPQVVEAQVIARQEFAGRWEYLLEDAIFTAPPHPRWSGAALMNVDGELCGIGSLVIQGFEIRGDQRTVNMSVPIQTVANVIDEICTHGRRLEPPRPWLGVLVHDEDEELTVVGVYRHCPADSAGMQPGDIVMRVGGHEIYGLGHFYRTVWSLGPAGVDVPITVLRNSARQELVLNSVERSAFMHKGTLQ